MEEYLTRAPGYLVNPYARGLCDYCPISIGDDYLVRLNISHSDRWVSILLFSTFTFTNIVLVYAFTFFPPRLPAWLKRGKGARKGAKEIAEEELRREEGESLPGGTAGATDRVEARGPLL